MFRRRPEELLGGFEQVETLASTALGERRGPQKLSVLKITVLCFLFIRLVRFARGARAEETVTTYEPAGAGFSNISTTAH